MFNKLEIIQKLETLLQLKKETEVVEFKLAANKFETEDIGRYFSALSNEANLKGEEQGWLVFGVEDKTHQVVGSNYKASRASLDDLKKQIADQMTNRITFDEIYEVEVDGKRVILFEIPAAPMGMPIAYKGHYYGRDGESLVALNIREIEQIRAQRAENCFELQVAKGNLREEEVLLLLDYEKLFELLQRDVPSTQSGILERLEAMLFIQDKDGRYDITNMGALLLARNIEDFDRLQSRRMVVRKYEGTNNRVCMFEQFGSAGYAVEFKDMVRLVESLTKGAETIEIVRESKSIYPTVTIREFLANALVHQDFDISGMQIAVEIYTNRLVFTNPGASLNAVNRLIDLPARSRNEKLAQAMFALHLCERRGTGVDRAVAGIEEMQLPAYEAEAGDFYTRITVFPRKSFDAMTKEEKIQACYQHVCLMYEDRERCSNQSIRNRFGLDKSKVYVASRVIADAIDAGLIKTSVPEGMSKKYASYIPYYG